jgi:hypothetical protein
MADPTTQTTDDAQKAAMYFNLARGSIEKLKKRLCLMDRETKDQVETLLTHFEMAIDGLFKESKIRRKQVVIMGTALFAIKYATNFEGAKMSADIATIAADYKTLVDQYGKPDVI